MKEFCPHGHPLSGDNLRERWQDLPGGKRTVRRECVACVRARARRYSRENPKTNLINHVRRSIKANMPGVVLTQSEGLFYSAVGCHPNSALGQAITGGDATARLRVRENRARDAADRAATEHWARRGFAT